MNIKYFDPIPATLEDLKTTYHKLAFQHHPDRGGSTEAMQAVNAEYDYLYANGLKDIHRNVKGETYTSHTPTSEPPEHFREIIEALLKLPGLEVEICGSFVWVSGNTRSNRAALKNLRFKFSPQKSAWYLAPENYKKFSKRSFTLDEIRGMYGSQQFTKEDDAKDSPTKPPHQLTA
jgi:curved DNA-binding protein CbpA